MPPAFFFLLGVMSRRRGHTKSRLPVREEEEEEESNDPDAWHKDQVTGEKRLLVNLNLSVTQSPFHLFYSSLCPLSDSILDFLLPLPLFFTSTYLSSLPSPPFSSLSQGAQCNCVREEAAIHSHSLRDLFKQVNCPSGQSLEHHLSHSSLLHSSSSTLAHLVHHGISFSSQWSTHLSDRVNCSPLTRSIESTQSSNNLRILTDINFSTLTTCICSSAGHNNQERPGQQQQ